MADPSAAEYIRWVKGSLNRQLGANLPDDGQASVDYRAWVITFQTRRKLTVNAKVDLATQNALVRANRDHSAYTRWVQNALLISGEGMNVGGKNIAADGRWGPHTEQAVKAFQARHEKTSVDGWVGAKTERLLMLRTGTIPPGRTFALREPIFDPVIPTWDTPVPDDDDPKLTGEGLRFDGSEGLNLSLGVSAISAGTLVFEDMVKRSMIRLSFVAVGVGKSPVAAGVDFSTLEMHTFDGSVTPNPLRDAEIVTLNDVKGVCLIYQAQAVATSGAYVTYMFLGMSATLFAAPLLGPITVAVALRSCRAVLRIVGVNHGTPNAGASGAIGYLSFGDARAHLERLKRLVGA